MIMCHLASFCIALLQISFIPLLWFPPLLQQYFEEDVSVMLYDSTETVYEQYWLIHVLLTDGLDVYM